MAAYTAVVLPMLPLGAPMGTMAFRRLDPAAPFVTLERLIQRRLARFAPARAENVQLFLYRVDLRLDMFPGQTSWRFMSTMPLSQLMEFLERPAPFSGLRDAPLSHCLANAPDITTPQEPLRVVHWIAEIVEGVPRCNRPCDRFRDHRRLLELADPDTFASLESFLATPPEPHARVQPNDTASTMSSRPVLLPPQAPYFLTNIPAIAQLTVPENKLFVRPVFLKLLDEILRDLPDKRRCVYVAATAGAGKTAFLWIVLHVLCQRGRTLCGQYIAPPMDIVLDVPGLFVLIDTAGDVFTGPRHQCFRFELMKKETLYLADLAHGRRVLRADHISATHTVDGFFGSFVGYASRILITRPHPLPQSRTTTYKECVVRLLPPWKNCELELCRRVCFPALDSAVLLARIKYWGHQPLWTLAMDPAEGVGEKRFLAMVHDPAWLGRIDDIATRNYARSMAAFLDDATYLLVLHPPPRCEYRDFDCWDYCWCSPAVCATNNECFQYI